MKMSEAELLSPISANPRPYIAQQKNFDSVKQSLSLASRHHNPFEERNQNQEKQKNLINVEKPAELVLESNNFTENFSDVLGAKEKGKYPGEDMNEREKLDELEQLAMDALDDI